MVCSGNALQVVSKSCLNEFTELNFMSVAPQDVLFSCLLNLDASACTTLDNTPSFSCVRVCVCVCVGHSVLRLPIHTLMAYVVQRRQEA